MIHTYAFLCAKQQQSILRSNDKLPELVCLYRTRGYHRKALEILKNNGENARNSNPMYGPDHTVKYLQVLSQQPEHAELVLEYSTWVLKKLPEEGLRIFTYAHNMRKSVDGTVCVCVCALHV